MSVTVRLYAAAAEAAGTEQATADGGTDAGTLRRELVARYGEEFARVLARCSLVVDGLRADDDDAVPAGATVDVLPPFAGG